MAAFAALVVGDGTLSAQAQVDVTQHHNNPSRDGLYIDSTFTRSAAAGLQRDPSFNGTISGHVYAQPLYIEGGPGGAALVIVVTESNDLYALNAATGLAIWHRNVGAAVPLSALLCGNIDPLGITGTPVVDLSSRTLLFDAMTTPDNGATKRHLIFALNVDTGTTLSGWPVDVTATASFGGTAFDSALQNERGALMVLNGTVYVPYGGHFGDCGAYHGWLVGVPLTNPASVTAWATAAQGGGAWAVGGVASDGQNLFIATGNTFNVSTWSGGESINRFLPGPVFSDHWTPQNWVTLDNGDIDIGGSGPVLVDVPGANPSQLVVSLGKDGNAYLVNRNNPGGVSAPVAQAQVSTTEIIQAAAAYHTAQGTYVAFHGSPVNCTGDLGAFRINAGSPPSISMAWCATQNGGGSPFVTSTDGTNNVIVWGIGAEGDGRLHGFDADSGAVIYSGGGANELMSGIHRYNTGIVARGRIFVAGDNGVYAFKLPATNQPPVANNDAYYFTVNTTLTMAAPGVLGNDSDPAGNTLTAVLVTAPTHGALSLAANGGFTYSPLANFSGTDSFTYTANDGTTNSGVATVTLITNAAIPGLVAYWAFDEGLGTTAADSSGNGYNLSLVNGPTWTAGKFNRALSFNGVNNYAVSPAINLGATAAVSVSLWLNRTYIPQSSSATVLFESSANFNSSTTGFMFFPDDPYGMAIGLHGNSGYNIKTYTQPSGGVWHHLVAIYNKTQNAANEVTFYLDGTLQTAGSLLYGADNSNAFGTNPLYLFSRSGTQLFASGTIDELRIYNRALTAAEVGQLYGMGAAPDTQPPSVPTNLVATALSASQIKLAWSAATDNLGVTGYQVFSNGTQIAISTATAYTNSGLAPSTTYSYAVAAFDAAGNVSARSLPASATTPAVDTTPPSVSITNPANGAIVSNTVSVSASATDNVGVVGVQFKLDGSKLGSEVTATPYQVSWDTTSTTNGSHTLGATARDAAGNTNTATATVIVSNTLPTQGLVAHWAFDEGSGTTAADSSGNGYNLSLVNGPTWTTGRINGALSFNGINTYAVAPAINLGATAAASVSLWLNRTYIPQSSSATVLFESSANFNSSTTGFMFFPDDPYGMAIGLHGNSGYNIKTYTQPSSGVWHHLVAIYNKTQNAANEVTFYLDGALQTANSQLYGSDNSNAFGTNPLYLFARGGTQLFASGTIDEMRIYNRALTAAEVGQLYNVALAQTVLSVSNAPSVTQVPITLSYKSSDNSVQLSFQGTPGQTYQVQWCPKLFETWRWLATVTADTAGQAVYDGPAPGVTAFFRVVLP